MERALIDVILSPNARAGCCDPRLIHYSAGGVVMALAKKGFDARRADLKPEENSADVCCYAVFFGNKANAFRHMEAVRRAKKAPRLIIAFGSFASVFSEEILSRGLADMVVDNDPEFVIPAVLQEMQGASSLETIPNLSYRHQEKIIHTRKQSFHDLDEIPFISPYLYSQGHRPAFTMTARGCQYHCVFCDRNVLWGGGVRNRNVVNVLQEIKELVEVQHAQVIEFLDEDLAADQKRLAALCEGMRRIKGEFYWQCSACVDSVSREILLLMGRSRCREIYFGVESASPQVLRRIGKTYGRQDILNAVRWSQAAGLKVEVMITIGNPGETDADRDLTLSALNELGQGITVRTNRIVVLPGTAFYRKGLSEGRFTQKSFFEDEGIVFY
jgi:anaerobic magnesium-protoporphyrin IX monomethyl ester cyclase